MNGVGTSCRNTWRGVARCRLSFGSFGSIYPKFRLICRRRHGRGYHTPSRRLASYGAPASRSGTVCVSETWWRRKNHLIEKFAKRARRQVNNGEDVRRESGAFSFPACYIFVSSWMLLLCCPFVLSFLLARCFVSILFSTRRSRVRFTSLSIRPVPCLIIFCFVSIEPPPLFGVIRPGPILFRFVSPWFAATSRRSVQLFFFFFRRYTFVLISAFLHGTFGFWWLLYQRSSCVFIFLGLLFGGLLARRGVKVCCSPWMKPTDLLVCDRPPTFRCSTAKSLRRSSRGQNGSFCVVRGMRTFWKWSLHRSNLRP